MSIPHAPAPRPALRRAWLSRQLSAAAATVALATAFASPCAAADPSAPAVTVHSVDVGPGRLTDVLNRYALQAGVLLAGDSRLTDALHSDGLRGAYTVEAGFAALLARHGLQAQRGASGSWSLRTVPQGISTLAPVTVDGRTESATGPVDGLLARRSAGGTKTDTSVMETPQAVSVITRDQMQAQDVQSVSQALRYSSGVFTEYRGSSNQSDEIFMRGFGYAPKFLDGLAYGSASKGQIDPWLLERVEVVRGPSSVLYGQASPGGILNLVSKRPQAEALREVQFDVGNHERASAAFDAGGKIDEDGKLLYRLSGLARTQHNDVDGVRDERVALAPAFTWLPNSDTRFTLLTSYQNEPEAGYRNFLPAMGLVYGGSNGYGHIPRSFNGSDPDYDKSWREQGSVGYELEHRLNSTFTLRQNLRYSTISQRYRKLVFGVLLPDQATFTRTASDEHEKIRQVVVDNQAQADFDLGPTRHTVLAGVDYRQTRTDYQLLRGKGPTLDWRNPVYGQPVGPLALMTDQMQTASQLGAYLQDQVRIGQLNVVLGGRKDWSRTRTENRLGADSRQDDDAFTGRVGAIYNFDNGLAPYASYSTSFEPELTRGAPGSDPFKPTTGKQWEAGLKYQPPGTDAMFTASYFDLRQRNVATYDSTIGFNVQTGEIASRGVELEARGNLTRQLEVVASYTYVDPKVRQSSQAGVQGKQPARQPGHLAALWGMYTAAEGPLAGLGLGAGVRYVGTSYGDPLNTFKVPAVTLYDAVLRYDLAQVSPRLAGARLQLNINNLFDKTYVASCAGETACFYGTGRTVSASLNYRW
ncbi:Ferrichrome outer membrane transporter/phage receptor [Achromobacter deleyi]|uniref:Ferrichrome outer membrane transporter/phage receptor n=1 Tax=Achromobacter deleyi TaxID=1353891 RepID=A0A6S7ASI6_9BURK|nr:TonB-dependent siderophore receptor [Achromobacter deleyi]CAB3701492.1 Ferrichrome outer membrane transporter/phage receptor [Achromobacter deleyi]CAB3859434.1 Ferrichrome outer membrane transporter/phage receptor [Achromobacter deleyi]CAB3918119.1 Ferrichrome outer membrane transporter/phage receptor [Achromobacter deleyi]